MTLQKQVEKKRIIYSKFKKIKQAKFLFTRRDL